MFNFISGSNIKDINAYIFKDEKNKRIYLYCLIDFGCVKLEFF